MSPLYAVCKMSLCGLQRALLWELSRIFTLLWPEFARDCLSRLCRRDACILQVVICEVDEIFIRKHLKHPAPICRISKPLLQLLGCL